MLKKILIGVGVVVGLIVAVGVATPFLIDPNSFKPQIVAKVKEATGRDLVIDGPLKLSMFPSPSVSAESVRFSNAPGGKAAQMLDLKAASAGVSLWPLLSKRIEISEVRLIEPKIAIEVAADGRANYEFAPAGAASASGAAPATTNADKDKRPGGVEISAQRIVVVDGSLTYSDARTGREARFEKVSMTLSVPSLAGPFAVEGGLTANGVPLKLDGKLGVKGAQGVPLSVSVRTDAGEAKFSGAATDLTATAALKGDAVLSAANLEAFIASLARVAGQPAPTLPPTLARKIAFNGAIDVSATSFAARDFKLTLGEDQGSGTISVKREPTSVEGRLSFTKLDLDKWLALAPTAPPPTGAPSTRQTAPTPRTAAAAALPTDVTVALVFDAGEVVYNGAAVRKVMADIALDKGLLTIRKLDATLPGDAQLSGSSTVTTVQGKPTASGELSLAGPRLRETLTWLKIDVAGVPSGKLGAFSFKGKLAGDGATSLRVDDAVVQLDGMTMRGGVSASLAATPVSVSADFQADTIDLDAYLPKRAPVAATPSVKPSAPAGKGAAAPALATATAAPPAIDARVKAKIGRVVYNGERIEGVDADVTYRGGRLTFGDTRIGSVAGASVALKGSVANLETTPAFDLSVNVQTNDADRLLKLAGVASPVKKGPIGAVTLQGGVAGTARDLTFRDFAVNALGMALRMTGKVALPEAGPRYDLSAFTFQTADLDKLMAALGNAPAGVGSVSASGTAKGDANNVAFNGSFAVKGVQGSGTVNAALGGAVPRIVASLKTSALDIDQLSGGGGASSSAGGAPAAGGGSGGRFSNAPINLSALKSLEADIDLQAPSIAKSPWRLDGAQLRATLRGGVLTIAKLSGGMFGGGVDLSGTIDAGRAAFDLRLGATNINLGTAARTIGDSKRVDGVIGLTFAARGSLTSVAAIVSSIDGEGKVNGSVRFNASASEQVGGQVAGAALKGLGKQIDKLAGGKGGGVTEEIGDINAAIRVANERFANRSGPLSGTISMRDGQLRTSDLRVEGNRAWALTDAQVNLPAWTMATTTNVYVQESPEAPYVIVRQTGAIDSPSRKIDRGPAAASAGRPQQPAPGAPGAPGTTPAAEPGQAAPASPPAQQKPTDPLKKLKKIF